MGAAVQSMEGSGNSLWPHQLDAVEKICDELGEQGRATAVAACGTGKTLIGAECSVRLVPDGSVLIVVPTLELLSQTAHSYASHLGSAAGVIAAVCGDKQATDSAARLRAEMTDLHAPVTTDPVEVADLVGRGGRVTVFATYASLPVIVAAHAQNRLGRWGLVVVDEAHRTAGVKGQWAQIHDDRLVPAARRLYLTATPRIMTIGGTDGVSMDDPTIFGRQVFHLPFAAAIESGLLADYRVAVVTITDAEVAKLTAAQQVVQTGGQVVSARMLAMQIALAKAIRDFRLRRVITYHGRVVSATRFATGLSAAVDLLPGSEKPQLPVQACWVSGDMARRNRRQALALLQRPGESTVVVSNARVLAEGVDVPALDAVMFADPRDSATDVVQAVGRALRRGSDSGKVATIIVPIFLAAGENPQAALDSSEFDTVWRVVRALRAHDERIADYLDQRRQDAWVHGLHHRASAEIPPWLLIDGAPACIGDEFHRSILLRTVETTTSSWFENYGALLEFHAEHGHVNVPYDYRSRDGRTLGHWLSRCRRDHRAGRLPAQRAAKLAALGISWNPWATSWETRLSALRGYRTEHGHSNVPHDYTTSDGQALGAWLAKCRRERRSGKLSAEHAAALESLGIEWNPADSRRRQGWETGLTALHEYRAQHGHAKVGVCYVAPDGFLLGQWLTDRREGYRRGTLSADRVAELEAVGIEWNPADSNRNSRWEAGLTVLNAYRNQHGHANVPAQHVTKDGFRLGKWLYRCRSDQRAGKLSAAKARQLTAAGVELADQGWSNHLWAQHLDDLAQFRREYGHANPAQRHRTPDGFRLGTWISKCRQAYRTGQLTTEQIGALQALGVDLSPQPGGGAQRRRARWRTGLQQLKAYRDEHGHNSVSSTHITVDGFRLGAWLADCRRAYQGGDLPAEQAAALTVLGVDLRIRRRTWDQQIEQLSAYHREHGDANVPSNYTTDDGDRLGRWLSTQRRKLRDNELDDRQARQLRNLGVGPAGLPRPDTGSGER